MTAEKLSKIFGAHRAPLQFLLATGHLSLISKIFLRPTAYAIQRLLDIVNRVSHAEPQITFAEIAECGTGQSSDPRVIKQRIGQFLRWPPGFLDVRENVKCSLGRPAGETFDPVKAGDHHVPSFSELGAHRFDRFLWPPKSFDSGDLSEASGAGIGIGH